MAQVWSRTAAHAATAAAQFGAETVADIADINPDSDLYLIAVSDNAIADVAARLPRVNGVVVHTSGATPLEAIKAPGRQCGVLWSPQTFVTGVPMDYSELIFCIEADSPDTAGKIERMTSLVTSHIHHVDSRQRLTCHTAAVMVSNFGNALNALAEQLLRTEGSDLSLLRPIIKQTAAKADHGDLWSLQTGPAARGDNATIEAHRRLLSDTAPNLLPLYDLFTQIIKENTTQLPR